MNIALVVSFFAWGWPEAFLWRGRDDLSHGSTLINLGSTVKIWNRITRPKIHDEALADKQGHHEATVHLKAPK